jgi:hypothetical protein
VKGFFCNKFLEKKIMKIVGIDPGKSGYAVGLGKNSNQAWKIALKYDGTGLLKHDQFKKFLEFVKPDLVLLEKIQGRGGWGATQTFSMGQSYGQIHMLVACSPYPYRLVPPQTWQKVVCEGVAEKLPPKSRADAAYRQLFKHDPIPNKRGSTDKNDNLLDAWLLAFYGIMKYARGHVRPWEFINIPEEV